MVLDFLPLLKMVFPILEVEEGVALMMEGVDQGARLAGQELYSLPIQLLLQT
jgi:hypothetical protein